MRGENEICENLSLFFISHSCRLFILLFNPEGQVNVTKCVFSISPLFLFEVSIYICLIFLWQFCLYKISCKICAKIYSPDDIVIQIYVDEHFPFKAVSVSTSLFSVQVKISVFKIVVYSWNRNKSNYHYQIKKNKMNK